MDELKTLFRQSSHYFAGRVGVILLGFVSFPLFTRLFSVADYGLMGLVLKVTATFTVLSKMGIQNSVLRFYQDHAAASERNALQRYFSTLFFGTAGVATLVALSFLLGVWLMPTSLVTPALKGLLAFAAILIFVDAMSSILSGFLRVEERTKAYNVLDVAQKAATVLAVCAFFFAWRRNVWGFFAGSILVDVLVVVGVSLFLAGRHLLIPRLFDRELLRGALVFGAPLVIYEFASVVLDSGDRILVQHYLGSLQLGYYSAAYNMAAYLQAAVMAPLSLSLFPIYMRLWVKKGKEETQAFLSRGLDLYLLLVIGVVAMIILTARDAVLVLASSKFQQAQQLVPMLVLGIMVYTVHIFLAAGLLIHKKTGTMAKLVCAACVLNIVLNIFLIPRIGLQGAAAATLISYVFLILIMARASFQVLPFRIEYGSMARYAGAAAVAITLPWRLDLGTAVGNLVTKGLLGAAIYIGIIWTIDPRVRELITEVTGLGQQHIPRARTVPATHNPARGQGSTE